ncbi:non-specific lipid-transfer protein-like [Vitis riparia]|uniref:non-specific lipid-transfer protein-like n=1 Tax=Vitis riparia TaxID=96939 RepID=UPI00155AF264|nr:non-specific lipid-transfer protein-like [Vitis riparia]XP_034698613.1 non-specific lipid-transfer protein-like [Vitis riparia]
MAEKMVWVHGLVVLALIIASPVVDAVSCGDAVSALIPCGSFLLGVGAPKPSSECCASAQSLNKLTTTTADRRAVCQCFVKSGPSFGVKPARTKLLPSLCKININIPVTPNVDCNKVQ